MNIVDKTKSSDLDKALDDYAKFLIAHSWSSDSKVKKIFSVYKTIQSISGNKQSIVIKTARKLTESEKKSAINKAQKICSKDVEVEVVESNNILGGIILEGYDWRFCADVKSNLEKLRANLINS